MAGAVEADVATPHKRHHLRLGPQQLTLLSAVITALQQRGIGAGVSMWRNTGKSIGLHSVKKAVAAAKVKAADEGPTIQPGLSAHARKRQSSLVYARHSDPKAHEHATIGASAAAEANGTSFDLSELGDGDGSDGCDSLSDSGGEWIFVNPGDGGQEVARKIAAAVEAARPKLDKWEAQEFRRSVLIVKESEDAIGPIIDQLKGVSADVERRDAAAAAKRAAIQERCLRVLQALLKADASLQVHMDNMGVTSVMLRTLAAPSTQENFEAALELGIALLDGGNRKVQQTIYKELSSAGTNAVLSSLAHTLNTECNKVDLYFSEQRQHEWYAAVLEPHLSEAIKPRPDGAEEVLAGQLRASETRGSGAVRALVRAVAEAQQQALATRDKTFTVVLKPKPSAPSSMDPTLANRVLLLIECMCEGHYGEMQAIAHAVYRVSPLAPSAPVTLTHRGPLSLRMRRTSCVRRPTCARR